MLIPIGELARRSGLEGSAIRYYESLGLLEASVRRGGKRWFTPGSLDRLGFIQLCQQAGLALRQVKRMLEAGAARPSEAWQAEMPRLEKDLKARAAQLQTARRLMDRMKACACGSLASCARLLAVEAARPS